MDEVVKAFLLESHENLQQMEQDLMGLEERPDDRDLIASIFRTVHTIKGTCGFLGFPRLEALTHTGENLLAALRDGAITADREVVDRLFALVDTVRRILATIESTGSDKVEHGELAASLSALREKTDDPQSPKEGQQKQEGTPAAPSPTPSSEQEEEEPSPGSLAEGSVRVDVGLLDVLMDRVGELVLARNQLLQLAELADDPGRLGAYRRLDRITNDLQAGVMKTRMQPLEQVFQLLPRVARDLAKSLGKSARLAVGGGDIELDRSILEAIKDPLIHLVRNALDHGIERPEDREGLGKPREGRVSIVARHEGGQVTVEVGDDGAGIDPALVKARAIELAVTSPDAAAKMTDAEALNLIFVRGFSASQTVTSTSGRGVGMDVVRVNVERVGGSVEILSEVDAGTTARLKIPLTLAIIPALIVTDRGERYAIPQVNVLELARATSNERRPGIEAMDGISVFRLRGRLLPIVYLGQELWGDDASLRRPAKEAIGETQRIVVLQAGDRQFGLIVDDVEGTQEVVVKPLGNLLTDVPVLAGATILGDGTVALILDAVGLAQRAGVISEARRHVLAEQQPVDGGGETKGQQLLLIRSPGHRLAVLPLDLVVRLERLDTSAVEWLGEMEVVQHHGEIVPLVRVAREGSDEPETPDPVRTEDTGQSMLVVVYSHQGQRMGLVVGDVVDIVQETPELQNVGRREGVLGSLIVHGRVAEFLDVNGLIQAAQRAAAERERRLRLAAEEELQTTAGEEVMGGDETPAPAKATRAKRATKPHAATGRAKKGPAKKATAPARKPHKRAKAKAGSQEDGT